MNGLQRAVITKQLRVTNSIIPPAAFTWANATLIYSVRKIQLSKLIRLTATMQLMYCLSFLDTPLSAFLALSRTVFPDM